MMLKSLMDFLRCKIEQYQCPHPKWEKGHVDAGAWWYRCPDCHALTRNPEKEK